MKGFFKRKTTWAGITVIVGAIAGMATGTIDVGTGLQTIVISLVGVFIRDKLENPS